MNRRFALIQALVSVVALAAVVWWATNQEAPEIPSDAGAIWWLLASLALYAGATLARAERWHHIIRLTGVESSRKDTYALTTVGYMGNNVLPARAGEMLRVVLLSTKTGAGKRTLLGTVVAERLLDLVVLAGIFLAVVYGVLSEADALPTDRPLLVAAIGAVVLAALIVALVVVRRHHVFEKVRDFLRPLSHAPRALLRREGIFLLGATLVVWIFEGSVYLTVANAVGLDLAVTGAFYLVALTNFFAALPAAPGSIGTFDAAVAFGVKAVGGTGSQAVTYLLMLRFILYVPITVVGLVFLVTRYGGWSKLRTATRLEASSA